MVTPTDEQLREYVKKLPDIYLYILKTYPNKAPDRRHGDGLTEESIQDSFIEVADEYPLEEISDALDQLVGKGFLGKHKKFRFFSPTPLGERLITVLSGHSPRDRGAPPLPEPTWS